MSKLFKIFIFLFFSVQINAQTFFKPVSYGKNFVSDLRNTSIQLQTGYLNKISDYYYLKDNVSERMFTEARFGYSVPIFSFSGKEIDFSLSLPGGSVTLTDMFEKSTAPVINTDYWFGTEVRIIKRFSGGILKNGLIKIYPIFHESTHIGDEFSLHGYSEFSDFKRINISYEAWKISLTLNDPDTLKGNIFSLKAGIQNIWAKENGMYFTDVLEVKGEPVAENKKTFEYFFSFNYRRNKGFMCSAKWQNIISAEINNRIKLSYDLSVPEERVWSYNLYFGWEHKVSDKPFSNTGFFVRHYEGLNPHGQFRNENGFRFTGISLVFR